MYTVDLVLPIDPVICVHDNKFDVASNHPAAYMTLHAHDTTAFKFVYIYKETTRLLCMTALESMLLQMPQLWHMDMILQVIGIAMEPHPCSLIHALVRGGVCWKLFQHIFPSGSYIAS